MITKGEWRRKTFWEKRFESEDTPWDQGEPSPTIVALEKNLSFDSPASVLVPGCGYGHDAFYFARKHYQVSVIDWAREAIEVVLKKAKEEHLEIEALVSDFWSIPASWEQSFDVWVEHAFFCAIDPVIHPYYVEQVLRFLKPGGHFLGALFVTEHLSSLSVFPDQGFQPPFWTTPEEIHLLFSPYFEIQVLKRSEVTLPERQGMEWKAHFIRKA